MLLDDKDRPMLSPRFLAMPVIALAVIVALSQAHSGASGPETAPVVFRAVNCSLPSATLEAACTLAGQGGATIVR